MTDTRTEQQRLADQGLFVESVGDILEQGSKAPLESEAKSDSAFALPVLEGYAHSPLQPGIYFGLPEEIYHAIPALNASGIKDLAASQMVYWDRCRWMNPDWEEREEKAHLILGKAYECRILEGKEAFDERFAVAADRRDYPDALVTRKDIAEKLAEYGIEKCPPSKDAAFERLVALDPDAQLWDRIVAEHEKANEGKVTIPAADLRRIEIANRIVQLDEEQATVVNQGHAQASLIWTCPATGVPMKCRADKLLTRAIVDMKTIGNIDGSFDTWVPRTIANYRYNIQPSTYFEGANEVRKLIRERGASVIHSCDLDPEPGPISVEAHAERVAWALKWASNKAPDEWLWLFVQTKPPITRLVHYPRGGVTKMVTDEIVSRMKRRFRQCAETFGLDPWLDLAPRIDLADEDIPKWATEI